MHRTLQDRLIKEIRLQKISCIEEADRFLPKFIKSYNQMYGVKPLERKDGHRPLDKNNRL